MASPPTASRKTRSRSASSRASTTRSASSSAAPTVYAIRNICGSRCSHACSQRSEVAKNAHTTSRRPKILSAHTRSLQRHQPVNIVREPPSVANNSTARNAVIAVIIFFVAHFALLIGVTTPEKFYFDEVHYVPAARQMLEPVMSTPVLNPMHPPLAKQLMALSIRAFGDVPLGWRYPSVLFGSLAIVAMYLCGLALFAAQGPAVASALLA